LQIDHKTSLIEPKFQYTVRVQRSTCDNSSDSDLPEIPLVFDGEFRRPDELDKLLAVKTEPLRFPLCRRSHIVHALRQRRNTSTDQRTVPTSASQLLQPTCRNAVTSFRDKLLRKLLFSKSPVGLHSMDVYSRPHSPILLYTQARDNLEFLQKQNAAINKTYFSVAWNVYQAWITIYS